jgi:hypothetical protein
MQRSADDTVGADLIKVCKLMNPPRFLEETWAEDAPSCSGRISGQTRKMRGKTEDHDEPHEPALVGQALEQCAIRMAIDLLELLCHYV